jgi:extracellular matrix regulatory protein A
MMIFINKYKSFLDYWRNNVVDKKIISIGRDNFIPRSRIIGIFFTESSPMRNLISEKREEKKLVDATRGRKTRSAILLDNGYLILSPVKASTLVEKFQED